MKIKFAGLFRKKDPVEQQAETAFETTVETSAEQSLNPYLNAQRTWNDHVGRIMSSRRMWQMVAVGCLLIALVAVGGIVQIGRQCKLVPYVVEVNKLGEALAIRPAQAAQAADPRVIEATVTSFVSNARLVTPDVALQRDAVLHVYAVLSSNDPATVKMNEWLNGAPESNPFKRAEKEMVSIDIKSVMPQTDSTWQVDWVETVRDRKGVMTGVPCRMRALVTVYVAPPTAEEQIRKNPLGIFVRDFSWTKEL
jgi:type IV secretion system protein TrbF